jgi:hypothetical protein
MISIKDVRVAICSPVGDMAPPFWAYDLFRMGCYNAANGIKQGILMANGSLIPKQRENIMQSALDEPSFTHTLWLDSDLRFPPNLLDRLLAHKVGAVCASYTERTPPYRPVAFPDPNDFSKRVYTAPDSTGLQQIYACGFGCVLLENAVVEKIPKPRFMVGWNKQAKVHVGEDIYFFMKLIEEAKEPLWLDHDLTKELLHIGRYEFGLEHAYQAKAQNDRYAEAMKAAQKAKEEEAASGNIQLVQ